jgi:hypothetical protein
MKCVAQPYCYRIMVAVPARTKNSVGPDVNRALADALPIGQVLGARHSVLVDAGIALLTLAER